jgi:hypothetical protein
MRQITILSRSFDVGILMNINGLITFAGIILKHGKHLRGSHLVRISGNRGMNSLNDSLIQFKHLFALNPKPWTVLW